MITIFAIPKPFRGHTDIIQRNALISWTRIRPRPEIILFGDEEGTFEICRELGIQYGSEIRKNEFGTPLLDDLFKKAQEMAGNDLLCYVNADIILFNDLTAAAGLLKGFGTPFLIVGKRWDAALNEPLDFEDNVLEKWLKTMAEESGRRRHAGTIDYFVFRRGLYTDIPPFAIGRTRWDHWLVGHALKSRAAVIDATSAVFVLHQDHDHAHVKTIDGNTGSILKGAEGRRNRQLSGDGKARFNIAYATHRLTDSGAKPYPASTRFMRVSGWIMLDFFLRARKIVNGIRMKARRALNKRLHTGTV